MSSPENNTPAKRSPLFGTSKTRLKALDEGVKKTIENAIQRYTEKRIEFCEALPEQTRAELHEEGMLQTPEIRIPGAAPAPRAQPAVSGIQRVQSTMTSARSRI